MLNILIIEDSPADYLLIQRQLRQDGIEATYRRAETSAEIDGAIGSESWDIILSDYNLPGLRFEDMFQNLLVMVPETPAILVTGTMGEERAVEMVRMGVSGFVLKENLVRLASLIERSLREARDHRAMREADEKIHLQAAVLEAAGNAIVITDTRGKIEWVNPAFTTITGYTVEEAVGKTPRDLSYSGHHDRNFYQNLWSTILSGYVWQGELTNRRKDGELYSEFQTITPIVNNSGKITHFVGIKVDVSERKALEQELRQAQRMESIGRLAGGVAHDFNNLLTVITGYTEVVLGLSELSERARKDLTQVYKAAERAASLTRQLLAFSRKQLLRPQHLNLNKIIADCAKMLERLVGEDIAIELIPAPDLWPVLADPGQVEQVIVNLVVNARDAIVSSGKILVETSNVSIQSYQEARQLDLPQGAYVCLSVCDTGTGMDESTQQQIFDPFFTTKGLGQGTGLGLATVYGIVKQSGGGISVASEVGKGTTFRVLLPHAKTTESEGTHSGTKVEIRRGTETVLIVEDEEPLRKLTERILKHAGYHVLAAANGVAALELVGQHQGPIHLVLTDVIMPLMGGKELSDRLAERYAETEYLYMSGYTDTALAARGVLEGKNQLLNKPFTASQLTNKIREVLDSRAAVALAP